MTHVITHAGMDAKLLPLVSVLMPTRNQAAYIDASLDSILQQGWPALEIIVMDGASTDGTVERLAVRSQSDPRIRFFSEPDAGPADALNKALKQARGSIIGWLNSDDLYTEGSLRRALDFLFEQPDLLMVYGQGLHRDERIARDSLYPTVPPSQVVLDAGLNCFICQPTVFFRRSMAALLGPFDLSLKTAFDFDYWVRAFRSFPHRIGFVDAVQAISRLHDNCITVSQGRRVCLESMEVVARHVGEVSDRWVAHQFGILQNELNVVSASKQNQSVMLSAECKRLIDDASRFLTQVQMNRLRQHPFCRTPV